MHNHLLPLKVISSLQDKLMELTRHRREMESQLKQMTQNETSLTVSTRRREITQSLDEVVAVLCRATNVALDKALAKLDIDEVTGRQAVEPLLQNISALLSDMNKVDEIKKEIQANAVSSLKAKSICDDFHLTKSSHFRLVGIEDSEGENKVSSGDPPQVRSCE